MESLFMDLHAEMEKTGPFPVGGAVHHAQKKPPPWDGLMCGWKGRCAYSLESMDALYS